MELYCIKCKQDTLPIEIDHGIGPYEYGSIRGNDEDRELVSECCGEPLSLEEECEKEATEREVEQYLFEMFA